MYRSGDLLLGPFLGFLLDVFLLFALLLSLFCPKSSFRWCLTDNQPWQYHKLTLSYCYSWSLQVLEWQLVAGTIPWLFVWCILAFCSPFVVVLSKIHLFVDISPTLSLDNTNCWHYHIVTVGLSMYWSGNLLLGPFLGCLYDVFLLFALHLWWFCPKSTFSLISHRHSSLTIQNVVITISLQLDPT